MSVPTKNLSNFIHYNEFLTTLNHSPPSSSISTTNCKSSLLTPNYLIMTNSNSMNVALAKRMWNSFEYKICADGAANRLYDALLDNQQKNNFNNSDSTTNGHSNTVNNNTNKSNKTSQLQQYLPHYIAGDLDSIRPDVKQYYALNGVTILQDASQDYNDFEKCLQLSYKLATGQLVGVNSRSSTDHSNIKHDSYVDGSDIALSPSTSSTSSTAVTSKKSYIGQDNDASSSPLLSTSPVSTETPTPIKITKANVSIVALGAFGGRFDQEISAVHGLFKWKDSFHRIVLMDEENVAFLLYPGVRHVMKRVKLCEGPTCSLLPLGGTVRQIWTTGLHWNLHGDELRMGHLISTSNRIEDIKTSVTKSVKDQVSVCVLKNNNNKNNILVEKQQLIDQNGVSVSDGNAHVPVTDKITCNGQSINDFNGDNKDGKSQSNYYSSVGNINADDTSVDLDIHHTSNKVKSATANHDDDNHNDGENNITVVTTDDVIFTWTLNK